MKVVLFTNHCPNCDKLTKKLIDANIDYSIVDDINILRAEGFSRMPVLEVDGKRFEFFEAIQWLKDRG